MPLRRLVRVAADKSTAGEAKNICRIASSRLWHESHEAESEQKHVCAMYFGSVVM